jgi:alpha-L-fucosidase 2
MNAPGATVPLFTMKTSLARLLAAIPALLPFAQHANAADASGAYYVNFGSVSFDKPASDLVAEGLPIGNGRMGMLVAGGIDKESDAVCEDSVWSGWRDDAADNPQAAAALPEIRKLFAEGKLREAQDKVNATQVGRPDDGKGNSTWDAYGTYQMLARLEIETGQDPAAASKYVRDLDLSSGIVSVHYKIGEVNFHRSYFASRPDEVQVVSFTASKPGSISFSATLARPDTDAALSAEGNTLLLSGAMGAPDGKGLEYACRLGAVAEGGKVEIQDGKLVFTGCDAVTLFLTAGTNYKGIGAWPDYLERTGAHLARTKAQLTAAMRRSEKQIHDDHVLDFYERMRRCAMVYVLNLGDEMRSVAINTWPTPDLLSYSKRNSTYNHLIQIYFNFGRYLLLSSSREGSLPANLQGLWTVNFRDENQGGRWNYYTPWNGDYHANVNIQMNYWTAFSANMAECAEPLYDLIAALPGPGAQTAKVQHGAKGWTTHTMNNVWGFTSPGWEASWGHFPMAGPWMATHIWTGYAYTLDKQFLARMWPALSGSAEFVLSWMTFDRDGNLVSGPSESPENRFFLPDGSVGYFCMGPSMDQELCAQLLSETLRAAKVLGIESDLTKACAEALPKIKPVAIGPDGRLLEWEGPYGEPEPGHRHTSHLFGVWPGTTISPDKTPELAEAARKSLDYRVAHGGGYTGWSRADMIGKWARLGDGEKAYENLVALLRDSTLPNLFDTHPPFQIDGNFGAVAGIVEMLMQSSLEEDGSTTIRLLPALPKAWPRGEICGIMAQGAVEVSESWRDGKLTRVKFAPLFDITAKIRYGDKSATVELKAGVATELGPDLKPRTQEENRNL